MRVKRPRTSRRAALTIKLYNYANNAPVVFHTGFSASFDARMTSLYIDDVKKIIILKLTKISE